MFHKEQVKLVVAGKLRCKMTLVVIRTAITRVIAVATIDAAVNTTTAEAVGIARKRAICDRVSLNDKRYQSESAVHQCLTSFRLRISEALLQL